jgi:hypothetical protein
MRRHAPFIACAALVVATIGLATLALSPRTPRTLSLSDVIEAPVTQLAVVAGLVAPPVPWDDSPAKLMARTKTSNCAIRGPYPDAACTPGAVFASSTLEQICQSGYTKTVRNVSTKTKKQLYAAYGIAYPQPTGTYEADHLIPLELGGSNAVANLFPEAAAPQPGFKEKDLVENYLHQQVCDGLMPLPRAQEAIAHDWVAVYQSIPQSVLAQLKAQYASWANRD